MQREEQLHVSFWLPSRPTISEQEAITISSMLATRSLSLFFYSCLLFFVGVSLPLPFSYRFHHCFPSWSSSLLPFCRLWRWMHPLISRCMCWWMLIWVKNTNLVCLRGNRELKGATSGWPAAPWWRCRRAWGPVSIFCGIMDDVSFVSCILGVTQTDAYIRWSPVPSLPPREASLKSLSA